MARGPCPLTDEPCGHLAASTHCAEAAATDLKDQSLLPLKGEGAPPQLPQEDRVGSLMLLAVAGLTCQPHTPLNILEYHEDILNS